MTEEKKSGAHAPTSKVRDTHRRLAEKTLAELREREELALAEAEAQARRAREVASKIKSGAHSPVPVGDGTPEVVAEEDSLPVKIDRLRDTLRPGQTPDFTSKEKK